MSEGFQFSDLSYFLILALIPGIVETAKKWEGVAAGNRPLLLSLVLGFFLVGVAEAISPSLVSELGCTLVSVRAAWAAWARSRTLVHGAQRDGGTRRHIPGRGAVCLHPRILSGY